MLDVSVFNQTETAYTVEMTLFRVGDDLHRSEARAYSASIAVDSQGEARREDVGETRQYLVQYDLYANDRSRTDDDHVHFYPTDGEGEGDELAFDIRPPGVLTRR
jgi:hypothetical protein